MNYIFDFDGTIADSVDLIIREINSYVPGITREELAKEEVAYLGQTKLSYFLNEFGVKEFRVLLKSRKIRQSIEEKMDGCKPYPGIVEVIKKLKDRGDFVGLLTSSREDVVKNFLKKNVLEIFDFIITNVSLFKKSKVLKEVLEKYKLDPLQTYYIGDEQRDSEAAIIAGMKSVCVTWGIYSQSQLEELQISYIKNPKEILKLN